MTLRDLAQRARLNHGHLSRIERGDAKAVGRQLMERLAAALEVSVADITRGDDDMPPTEKAKKPTREVPFPGTPEGEVFHYTPDEAARFLPYTALTLRRKAYAREIPYNDGGSKITLTGRDIREISESTAVRPLAETTRTKNPAA